MATPIHQYLRPIADTVSLRWNAEKLLEAKNIQTWFKGKKVFDIEA